MCLSKLREGGKEGNILRIRRIHQGIEDNETQVETEWGRGSSKERDLASHSHHGNVSCSLASSDALGVFRIDIVDCQMTDDGCGAWREGWRGKMGAKGGVGIGPGHREGTW